MGAYAGWLKKLGADKFAKRRASMSADGGLKERWFELHPAGGSDGATTAQLRYYKPAGTLTKSRHCASKEPLVFLSEKPKGAIDLVGTLRVADGDEPGSGNTWPEGSAVFRLVGEGKGARTWVLCAPSEEARREWLGALATHVVLVGDADAAGAAAGGDGDGSGGGVAAAAAARREGGGEAAAAAAAAAAVRLSPSPIISHSAAASSATPVSLGSVERMASAAALAPASAEQHGHDALLWFEPGELRRASVRVETALNGTAAQIAADAPARDDGARTLRKDDVIVAVGGRSMHGAGYAEVMEALKALKASSVRGSITVRRPQHFFPPQHRDSLDRRASSSAAAAQQLLQPFVAEQPAAYNPMSTGEGGAGGGGGRGDLADLYDQDGEPPCCARCFTKHGGTGMGARLQEPLLAGGAAPQLSASTLSALHMPAGAQGGGGAGGISQIDVADL